MGEDVRPEGVKREKLSLFQRLALAPRPTGLPLRGLQARLCRHKGAAPPVESVSDVGRSNRPMDTIAQAPPSRWCVAISITFPFGKVMLIFWQGKVMVCLHSLIIFCLKEFFFNNKSSLLFFNFYSLCLIPFPSKRLYPHL